MLIYSFFLSLIGADVTEFNIYTGQKLFLSSTYLGEIPQHFRHFISTLSAANINDDFAVGILGQRLRDHSLPTSKGAWYSSGATLYTTIQHRDHVVSYAACAYLMHSIK